MKIIRSRDEFPREMENRDDALETAAQLQKDFLSFSVLVWDDEEKIPENWDEIFQRVVPLVESLLEKDPRKLIQVFYRMDLSERLLKESLSQSRNSAEEISVMMIHREWLKVKWRRFSSPKKLKD